MASHSRRRLVPAGRSGRVAVLATAAVAAALATVPAAPLAPAARATAGSDGDRPAAEVTVQDLVARTSADGTVRAESRQSVVHGWSVAAPATDGQAADLAATEASATGAAPAEEGGEEAGDADPVAAGAGGAPGGADSGGADSGGVVTGLAPLGTEVATGTVLYEVDDQPVVAVVGDEPLWRALHLGVSPGPDVRLLEEALVDTGHGDAVTVDETFDDATAAGVASWESALGRADPDDVVEPGDLVVVRAGDSVTRVVAQRARVGVRVSTGDAVADLGTDGTEVVLAVDAADVDTWEEGTVIELAWPDGSAGSGPVVEVGRDVVDGTVEVVVAPDVDAGAVPGLAVTGSAVTDLAEEALSVPVSAVVAGADGRPVVRRLASDGADGVEEVRVTLGIAAGSRVEVTGDLDEGDLVVLPGG